MKPISTAALRAALLFAACLLASAAAGAAAAPGPSAPGMEASAPQPGGTGASLPSASAELPKNAEKFSVHSASPSEQALEAKIAGWIGELSRQPGFESWSQASHRTEVLGPGTHSWLVTVIRDGDEAGYLVVTFAPDGTLGLAEYGSGPYPLFSLNTLHRVLAQRGLILDTDDEDPYDSDQLQRIYLGPMESYWIVKIDSETLYLDAKSGQRLPDLDSARTPQEGLQTAEPPGVVSLPDSSPANPASPSRVETEWHAAAISTDSADTGWIKPSAWLQATPSAAELLPLLQRTPVGLLLKVYGDQCLYPLAVDGFHEWNDGSVFVGLEQEGSRFLAWTTVERGRFFPASARTP
ncbi:hypothetical protein [Gorillibacterium sp. sgz500922]|uniref:hypothetical protein n=1 Tax=Gorillibacterium sp. sgz500922 TaxID=3446694 RepID=UPI003F6733C5